MAECLNNAVVLRTILKHISNPELLKLSTVNKLWNYEARSVMRIRGSLLACLKFHDNQPCQEHLDAFTACLLQMNVIPFSGIRIQLGHCKRVCQIPVQDSTYQSIIEQLTLKAVSVVLAADYLKNKSCSGSMLAGKLMRDFCGVLQEVEIAQIGQKKHFHRSTKMIGYVKDSGFPNLKILKLGGSYIDCEPTYMTDLLRALVTRAPKLQELHTQGPMNLMLSVLEGRLTVMLVLQSSVSMNDIPDEAIKRIRLEHLRFSYSGLFFNAERFNRTATMLLRKFSATIHSIDVDEYLAVALMCYGIRLEKVKSLHMNINYRYLKRFEPRILGIIKDFDFTRIFPNLDKVEISSYQHVIQLTPDHMLAEQASTVLQEPEPDRATSIKELDLSGITSISNSEFYAEMFPHIKLLRVEEVDSAISFESIWKNWVSLKELNVVLDVQNHIDGLDSVFCGIFPEEVAELRQKDNKFLKKVNIVPVMPAITCLRDLRTLVMVLVPLGFNAEENLQSPLPIVFSKVTKLIAFARNPQLSVSLSTYVRYVVC